MKVRLLILNIIMYLVYMLPQNFFRLDYFNVNKVTIEESAKMLQPELTKLSTPVHQLAGGGGGIHHLDAPAQTGVDEEKRKDMIKRETADCRVEKKRQGDTSSQFCLRTILYSSPGSKNGQAAVLRER